MVAAREAIEALHAGDRPTVVVTPLTTVAKLTTWTRSMQSTKLEL